MVVQEQVGFRPSLASVLPAAGVLVVLGLLFPFDGVWPGVLAAVAVLAVVRLRQLTVLGDEDLQVTVLRTHRIPWARIEGFEAGSRLRGGTIVRTTDGEVHAIAPCSWWGGPADPRDLETLRRVRAQRLRRR